MCEFEAPTLDRFLCNYTEYHADFDVRGNHLKDREIRRQVTLESRDTVHFSTYAQVLICSEY